MTTPLVIDASAGVELLLNTELGRRLRDQLPPDVAEWAPEIYFAEVAATLRRAEIGGRISAARCAVALDRLLEAPIRRVQIKPLVSEAWTLRANVTVADGLYVVLARHLGAALVTADLNLAKAPGLDVELIVP